MLANTDPYIFYVFCGITVHGAYLQIIAYVRNQLSPPRKLQKETHPSSSRSIAFVCLARSSDSFCDVTICRLCPLIAELLIAPAMTHDPASRHKQKEVYYQMTRTLSGRAQPACPPDLVPYGYMHACTGDKMQVKEASWKVRVEI
jgi:hypothetical protein